MSENATIELNGKQITLQEGDTIQLDRSLFKVDNEFEVNTEKGRILIEPGDRIRVGGQHKAMAPSEFVSDGKRFSIEKGDDFDVVTTEDVINSEDVIEEGFWDELKRGFLGQDTAADEASKILGALMKLGRLIVAKAERVEKETGRNPYEDLFASKEMETLNELFKLSKEGLGGQKITVGEMVDILDLDDPIELINRIRDELIKIGDKRLAKRIEEIIPKGVFGKINQVWKNITGQKMARGEISRSGVSQSAEDPGLDQAIASAREKTKPVAPTKSAPSEQKDFDPQRLREIWDYIKKSGATKVKEAMKKASDYFGNRTNEEEIKQAIKQYNKPKAPAPAQSKPAAVGKPSTIEKAKAAK